MSSFEEDNSPSNKRIRTGESCQMTQLSQVSYLYVIYMLFYMLLLFLFQMTNVVADTGEVDAIRKYQVILSYIIFISPLININIIMIIVIILSHKMQQLILH